MQLPSALLEHLAMTTGYDRDGFVQSHLQQKAATSIRVNPSKRPVLSEDLLPVGWSRYGYYLPSRPSFTFDPIFHAGGYYVQEASSMLLEQAFLQLMPQDRALRTLDLCAAPGGKTTHLHSLLPAGSFLVANEVIRSRGLVLRDNLIRWGTKNVIVTQNDPEDFRTLENYFDWITVDAPCSGSGLFRKDPEAVDHWSVAAVQHCSLRQQRILSAAWQALRPGGILFYATCSYSAEENEQIASWLLKEKNAVPRWLELKQEWNITSTQPGYRCWPDKAKGEGFYCCCFQKADESPSKFSWGKVKLRPPLSETEQSIVEVYAQRNDDFYFNNRQTVYGWPRSLHSEWEGCMTKLKVIYAGLRVGELVRDKLIPDHALAMSDGLQKGIPTFSLDLSAAIAYLQRKPFAIEEAARGWGVITYQQFALGWVNALAGRMNNYYPKEFRILKEFRGIEK